MIIDAIDITLEEIALTKPYSISYKTTSSIKNLVIKILLKNGVYGLGAASVSKYVVGVDTESSYKNALAYKDELIGKNISSLFQTLELIEKDLLKDPGSRAAFNIALHDVFCKNSNIPLCKFLGQKIKPLPTSVTVGIKGIKETLEEIEDYSATGFKYIKIKLGQQIDQDIERILKTQERFKNSIKIRVDANQGWSFNDTVRFFNSVGNIELIEQPLKVSETEECLGFPKELKKIIALDESIVTPENAIKFSSKDYAGIFNIKLMKCGGISAAREIASTALAKGIDLMWGCNDESIISISAALNTALAYPNTKYLDLDGSLDLAKDIVKGGFVIKKGVMSPVSAPGLGVTLI
ncbi:MAG TPA: dipeptide epimerase [Flavobacteriaceae bacterium]|nr:dipeptide epimerase [Flavobacteriaceae bacterium]